jgi:NADP-reducing hydrogenase subunit HndB
MPALKSMEDLQLFRKKAWQTRQTHLQEGEIRVSVGMDSAAIAAGACETMRAIQDFVDQNNLTNIQVLQTGSSGLDSLEPIVLVAYGSEKPAVYVNINTEMANKISKEHLLAGNLVKEYLIERKLSLKMPD